MVDPITLGAKLVDVRDGHSCCCDDDFDLASVPSSVTRVFDDALVVGGEAKRVFVSIGIFSIIKLERRVQLLIPSYDFCIPHKECVGATDDRAYTQFLTVYSIPEKNSALLSLNPGKFSCPKSGYIIIFFFALILL